MSRSFKRMGTIFMIVAAGIVLAMGIARSTGLNLGIAGGISAVACILVYLMLDLKPEPNPSDATIVRLTRGSWHRKKKK